MVGQSQPEMSPEVIQEMQTRAIHAFARWLLFLHEEGTFDEHMAEGRLIFGAAAFAAGYGSGMIADDDD